jgi:preprotein translocase subunit SecD
MWFLLIPNNVLEKFPSNWISDFALEQDFNLGLDLKWWTHLDYKVDLTKPNKLNSDNNPDNNIEIEDLIDWIQATIEKRVNWLWVSEPNIYSSKAADEYHIIVELAWIKDIEKAKAIVWKTIQLEFKEFNESAAKENEQLYRDLEIRKSNWEDVDFTNIDLKSTWSETKLDWSFFKKAAVEFNQSWLPIVSIEFNVEWWKLFWEISSRNVWKQVAIFVWWTLISAPVINEAILWGSAQISWNFTIQSAVDLKNDLNTWAIWAPIILSWEHNVDASLWAESLKKSLVSWLLWLLMLILYMIYQYRLLWVIASIALAAYAFILLWLLKTSWAFWLPIVLTLAWIAWIILSIWMAVDANILIFERMKEERESWRGILASVEIWFDRAWTSIKDSNISSLITCAILIWFWTSMIRWFAVNLWIWILISMFTAVTFTRVFLILFLWKFNISDKFLFKNLKK